MNGPEHYREAERLLEHALTCMEGVAPEDCDTYAEYLELLNMARLDAHMDIAAAQVHATLALAAATALAGDDHMLRADCYGWRAAAASDPEDVARARSQLSAVDVTS